MAINAQETGGRLLLGGIVSVLERTLRQPLQVRALEPRPLDSGLLAELAGEFPSAACVEWEESGLAVCLLLTSADAAYITQAAQALIEGRQDFNAGVLMLLRQWAETMGAPFAARLAQPKAGDLPHGLATGPSLVLRFTYGAQAGWSSDGALLYSRALNESDPSEAPEAPAQMPAAIDWNGAGSVQVEPSADNLKMILDLELTATARLAVVDLRLDEVLALRTGSVVDLGRRVDAPVELLVNGKLVARAEVVVQDGQLALRVTEVVSPRARLESLS